MNAGVNWEDITQATPNVVSFRMFDWDEVPEQLGGPNKAALQVEAEAEARGDSRSGVVVRRLLKRLLLLVSSGRAQPHSRGEIRDARRAAPPRTGACQR